ncbi:DUF1538 domain-containing protein [Desulfonatronovibrio magnus]|uniref:DUF1538 domain-containing protein n=1 Tax=Desulfonatronovibrio magnus TaxID=698827 RepID=UPI0005EBD21D|nr:DUF1538 domain-containing protein [Desulfonatronovibrio magnus]
MKSNIKEGIVEVVLAVMPITIVVILLQVVLINMPWEVFARFLIGAAMVMTGLFLFLQGVKVGLLPMGEAIGAELPKRGSMFFLLFFAFVLGFMVTLAEPDVWVLVGFVDSVSEGLVNRYILVASVALGVGIFVTLAMLRTALNIPIAYLLASGYILILVLSYFTPDDFVPISFDAGGVTTGPVTVPFILALGLGVAAVLGGRSSMNDGFGLIGLASIGPVLGVMILGIIYS